MQLYPFQENLSLNLNPLLKTHVHPASGTSSAADVLIRAKTSTDELAWMSKCLLLTVHRGIVMNDHDQAPTFVLLLSLATQQP